MSVFGDYSIYYDLLYQDKDYESEANYIYGLINRFNSKAEAILELGCGTGKHSKLLSEKAYKIQGIDISDTMLSQALKFQNENLCFEKGDVRDYVIDKKFDAVISLFHVASYQTTNEDLKKYFETASKHLQKGGIFIFDTWYGPAVLNEKPENRVKNLENEYLKIQRKATPTMCHNENIVNVHYDVLITNRLTKDKSLIQENHKMRYLFKPELELMLNIAGFDLVHSEEWLSGKEIGIDTWGACFVGVKK